MGEGPPGSGIPKTPPTASPTAQSSATEEEEEGQAAFRSVARRAPLLCPPTWCHGQEAQGGAGNAGSAAPAARIPTTKSMSRTPRPALPLPTEAGGRTRGHSCRPAQPPQPLPAHPVRQTAPPDPAPGPPSPERRRDQLLSGTGGSFVTLLLLSHAGASPSPSSRHRVHPPHPSLSPPQAASPRSGRDICQRDGATPVPAAGRGAQPGGISEGISGVPRAGTLGVTPPPAVMRLRRPGGGRWRSRFPKAFPVGKAKDGRTDGGTERGFHAYQRSR